ncbi:CueP family metal-binding protein [Glutamicibacter sp.]|uniref:CueP family metal-binding protein n=1 Tax=Glutamicibacter sp. TaxID=1931995 RepID=UPI0028BD35CB|nr:CueP family metal-binding protein [Glutamicibacter sp.]
MYFESRPSNWSRQAVRLAAPIAALSLLLAGCSAADVAGGDSAASESTVSGSLAFDEFGLQGLSGEQVVDKLEKLKTAERPGGLMASVRPTELVLSTKSGEQKALELPKEKFYLSVAPYQTQSHDCTFHSLTTCQGELSNQDVTVDFTTDDGREILNNAKFRTNDNGFVGLWLPRDVSGTLTISSAGQSATAQISTGSSDPTCLTTMKLT